LRQVAEFGRDIARDRNRFRNVAPSSQGPLDLSQRCKVLRQALDRPGALVVDLLQLPLNLLSGYVGQQQPDAAQHIASPGQASSH
jgi:hypothetical protein